MAFRAALLLRLSVLWPQGLAGGVSGCFVAHLRRDVLPGIAAWRQLRRCGPSHNGLSNPRELFLRAANASLWLALPDGRTHRIGAFSADRKRAVGVGLGLQPCLQWVPPR